MYYYINTVALYVLAKISFRPSQLLVVGVATEVAQFSVSQMNTWWFVPSNDALVLVPHTGDSWCQYVLGRWAGCGADHNILISR